MTFCVSGFTNTSMGGMLVCGMMHGTCVGAHGHAVVSSRFGSG